MKPTTWKEAVEISDIPIMCNKGTTLCTLEAYSKDYPKLFNDMKLPQELKDKFPNDMYMKKCVVLNKKFTEVPSATSSMDMSGAKIMLGCFESLSDEVAL